MIISTGREDKWAGSDIVLRWREESDGVWVRHQEVVTDFRPYLFVNPDNFHQKDEKSNQFPCCQLKLEPKWLEPKWLRYV